MIKSSFYSENELAEIGFKQFGENVKISRKASIYTPEQISIGNHVRIDDFCILSGNISLGSYIHISAYTALYGRYGIIIEDYVTISGRVMVYSQSDDYSGNFMTNPMIPAEFVNVSGATVSFRKHSIVAAGSIILPGVCMHEGACLGAMSLLKKDIPEWTIYAGVPAKQISPREKKILEMEKRMLGQ
ncbi:MAG: acyltransferase [Paludibacter sp.]|nr:acyltransferase [Paludibacter sp.]